MYYGFHRTDESKKIVSNNYFKQKEPNLSRKLPTVAINQRIINFIVEDDVLKFLQERPPLFSAMDNKTIQRKSSDLNFNWEETGKDENLFSYPKSSDNEECDKDDNEKDPEEIKLIMNPKTIGGILSTLYFNN